ncbi:hypothetical protein NDU88_001199 [Pleurodeles waltl]|uniref:Uncharacterized protein n=1 Tax=Pleurodeles waltl TaxID=8319 RepID=A0AAV7U686_PLEWA|nr:hypothetical protein NDU88_001199 [Pleurodeles waltl]
MTLTPHGAALPRFAPQPCLGIPNDDALADPGATTCTGPVDTAHEVHEAPSHPAWQPRSTDASTIDSSVVTRPVDTAREGHEAQSRPALQAWAYRRQRFSNDATAACTVTWRHCTSHRPASHRSRSLTDAAGCHHRAAACTVTYRPRTSHRPALLRSPDAIPAALLTSSARSSIHKVRNSQGV